MIPPCLTFCNIRYVSRVKCPPLYLGAVAIEKEPSGCPWLRSSTLLIYLNHYIFNLSEYHLSLSLENSLNGWRKSMPWKITKETWSIFSPEKNISLRMKVALKMLEDIFEIQNIWIRYPAIYIYVLKFKKKLLNL